MSTPINNRQNAFIVIICFLIIVLFGLQSNNSRLINNIAENSQEKFDTIDQKFETTSTNIRDLYADIDNLAKIEYVDDRTEALREGYFDFYEEFKALTKKIEARLPIMRRL